MKKTFIALFFAVLQILPAYGAPALSPTELAKKIQQTYNRMESLHFHFVQHTSGELTGRAQQGEGEAFFLRSKKEQNQKMRWQYSRPDEQVIISDGNTFYMYFKKLQQVIISPARQLSTDLTYAFFTGAGELVRDFDIFATEKEQTIKLVPRTPQQQVAEIELQADNDGLITQITITDHFGAVTTLAFDSIEINPFAKSSAKTVQQLFSFTPPPGTEIIQQ